MNEELQERLMSYLESLEDAVSSTSDFVIEQAPMYVQELINWQIAEGIVWSIFFITMSIGFLIFNFTRLSSLRRSSDTSTRELGWGLGTFMVFLSVFMIFFAGLLATQSVKAYVAPRVVIVEHIQNKGN